MTINNWVTATGRILYLTTSFLRFGVTCIIGIEYIGLVFRAFVYNCGVQVKFEFRSFYIKNHCVPVYCVQQNFLSDCMASLTVSTVLLRFK